jgi:hypothetical protein
MAAEEEAAEYRSGIQEQAQLRDQRVAAVIERRLAEQKAAAASKRASELAATKLARSTRSQPMLIRRQSGPQQDSTRPGTAGWSVARDNTERASRVEELELLARSSAAFEEQPEEMKTHF